MREWFLLVWWAIKQFVAFSWLKLWYSEAPTCGGGGGGGVQLEGLSAEIFGVVNFGRCRCVPGLYDFLKTKWQGVGKFFLHEDAWIDKYRSKQISRPYMFAQINPAGLIVQLFSRSGAYFFNWIFAKCHKCLPDTILHFCSVWDEKNKIKPENIVERKSFYVSYVSSQTKKYVSRRVLLK